MTAFTQNKYCMPNFNAEINVTFVIKCSQVSLFSTRTLVADSNLKKTSLKAGGPDVLTTYLSFTGRMMIHLHVLGYV